MLNKVYVAYSPLDMPETYIEAIYSSKEDAIEHVRIRYGSFLEKEAKKKKMAIDSVAELYLDERYVID